MARPDAVEIPESYKEGHSTQYGRISAVADIADEILQLDKGKGELSYIRRQPGGKCFATRDPHDTYKYPHGHDLDGQERYRWEDHQSLKGVRVGYLKEEPGATA